MATHRIASGKTTPGQTAWQQYQGGNGIFVDVNTTAGNFSAAPVYITSIGGISSHWNTTGATSIYPTPPAADLRISFRVYVRWADGSPLTPAQANGFQWHINWVGMEV
jgi:hypothetical protein